MSLNLTLKGNLEKFIKQYSIVEPQETKAFEHFVNYLVVSKYSPDAIEDAADIFGINVDSKSQFGLDGIAIIVNGSLVLSPDDITAYGKSHKLDVQILFIQTKTENIVDTGSLLKTIHAAKAFLEDPDSLNDKNDNARNVIEIYRELFRDGNSRYFPSDSPQAYVYYATAASTYNIQEVEKLCREEERQFRNPDIRNLKINVLDASVIMNYYREVSNSVSVKVHMERKLELNQIAGVKKAYIGYLPGNEYLKMITDDSGDIRRRIFYENVRDYQGYNNPVNEEIRDTISFNKDKFVLLNNGVTIITRSLEQLGGNNFELRDFQIVNGCQTSYELFNKKDEIQSFPDTTGGSEGNSLDVPVKLIHTDDPEVIAQIVRATNRQSPVAEEAFIALSDYQKDLEDTFERYSETMPIKIFYERRSGEFENEELLKYQRVTLHQMIRTITSVYFQDAYVTVNNNPANTLRGRSNKLFQKEHPFEIYYISAYLWALLNHLHEEHKINGIKGDLRYYTIMVARILMLEDSTKPDITNTKAMTKECNRLIEILKGQNCSTYFSNARQLVYEAFDDFIDNEAREGTHHRNKIAGLVEFNKFVLNKAKELVSK